MNAPSHRRANRGSEKCRGAQARKAPLTTLGSASLSTMETLIFTASAKEGGTRLRDAELRQVTWPAWAPSAWPS